MDQIRKNLKSMSIEDAVDTVIANLPMDLKLRPFLREHQAEVKGMLLAEYNEVEQMELFMEEGRTAGRIEEAIRMYSDEMHLSPSEIIDKVMSRFSLSKADAETAVETTLDLQKV